MNKLYDKIAIIDGSYMLHRSLKSPELWELRSRAGIRTGGVFGFLRSLNYQLRTLKYYPVVCWDHGLAPRRLEVYPDYKHNLSKTRDRKVLEFADAIADKSMSPSDVPHDMVDEIKAKMSEVLANRTKFNTSVDPDDYYTQYRRQRNELISILHALGIPSIIKKDWEGDDLMVLLTRISKSSVVVTDDKDLIQLLSPTTNIVRPMAQETLIHDEYLKRMGYESVREIVITKAICGDGSDNIPSTTSTEEERKYKVGSKTAYSIAKIIYECNENPEEYLPKIAENKSNKYKGFVRCHDNYLRNMKLVDLRLVPDDYDIVNYIEHEVNSCIGKSNMLNAINLLSKHDISNFDVNGVIANIMLSSVSCKVQ